MRRRPAALVVAIDGPAASGKGTLARRLADHLGLPHLDTGLLYRAVARDLLDRGHALDNEPLACAAARRLDPARLDPSRLRGVEMGEAASIVSAHQGVRALLLDTQRAFAARPEGAVLDGRDIGTVVCPAARVKLFVTASPEERARRRHRELSADGAPSLPEVLAEIQRRDRRDESRSAAPLRAAPDAVTLDTTALDAEAAFARALEVIQDVTARS